MTVLPPRRRDEPRRGAVVAPTSGTIQRLPAVPAPAVRVRAIEAGQVLVLERPPEAFSGLLRRASELVDDAFALEGPAALAHCLPAEVFAARGRILQRRFAGDATARDAFWQTASALQMGDGVFRDQLFLRVLPPQASGHGGFPPLHPHRDTWGSRVMCQENWWAPVSPVSRLNTLGLYLQHWQQPVENESDTWSFEDYRAHRQAAGGQGRSVAYPSAPRAKLPPPAQEATPLELPVGHLALFSGAQLHVSLPNHSGVTRFSVETRTVRLERGGRLAPGPRNVDTAERPPYLTWFRDRRGTTLAEALDAYGS
ncbi:MAG: hypothetical protein AAF184_07280 [Pseudomonadota bacterium]